MRSPTIAGHTLRRTASVVLVISSWALLCAFGPQRPGTLGPGSLGRADASVASGLSTDALWTNPAGLKRGRGQSFEAGYLRDPWRDSNNFFLASADPNARGAIAGGATYGYEGGKLADGGELNTTELRFGMAAGARGDVAQVLIGASAFRLTRETIPKGGKASEVGDWSGDVGLAIDLASGLRIGSVLRNVIEVGALGLKRRVAAGIAYGGKKFVLEGAGSWTLAGDDAVYRVGGFFAVGDVALVRAGYVRDSWTDAGTVRQSATLGAGVSFGKARIDIGGEMNLAKPSEIRFGLSLVYFLPYAT